MIFNFANDFSAFNKLGNSYERRKQMADNALNDVKLLADATDDFIEEYKTDKLWDEVNARQAQANKLKEMESKYANWKKEQDANEAQWNAQQDDNEARYNRRVSAYQTPSLPEGAEVLPDGSVDYNGNNYSKEGIEAGNYAHVGLTGDMLQPKKEIAPYQRQAYQRPEYEGLQDLEAQRLVVGNQGNDWLWGKAMELKRLGDSTLYDKMVIDQNRAQVLADRDEQRKYEAGVRKEQQRHELALKDAEREETANKEKQSVDLKVKNLISKVNAKKNGDFKDPNYAAQNSLDIQEGINELESQGYYDEAQAVKDALSAKTEGAQAEAEAKKAVAEGQVQTQQTALSNGFKARFGEDPKVNEGFYDDNFNYWKWNGQKWVKE